MTTKNPLLEKPEQANQAIVVAGVNSCFPEHVDFFSQSYDIDSDLHPWDISEKLASLIQQQSQYNQIISNAMRATGALTQMDIDGLTKLIETQNLTLGRIESKLDKVDGRLGEVEQRLSKIEGHMPSLATQSQVSSVKSDLQTEMNKGLSPLQNDVTSIKTEISHHATKSWVYVTLAVASAGALAAIGSIFTIINSLPKH
ncbi:hypothetical protein [Acidithiobacillus thiooxidans]|uniref:Uncharacterized protein n=1 Tax=Acidithiobacillus thiooxidans ATCC 19377 TaxID=637390 RepID=A0A543PZG2_ACITH|nr:hypothetical protein [Acidithiobacillus thiooxidans]MDX5936458.1 hypothetical protein [Acidithiobacillus thiooxidans]TQN49441.1 hypothetical protein DLNHIDIE_03295 [Acidithiobacillus thiooxidans ATCC 19377]